MMYFPKKGDFIRKRDVLTGANMRWTRQQKPICRIGSIYAANTLINSNHYKSCLPELRAVLTGQSSACRIYCGGGAPEEYGTHGPNVASAFGSEFIPSVKLMSSQKLTKNNTQLFSMAGISRVMAHYVSCKVYKRALPGTTDPLDDKFLHFVGFQMAKKAETIRAQELEEMYQEHQEDDVKEQSYARFKECNSLGLSLEDLEDEYVKDLPTKNNETGDIGYSGGYQLLAVTNWLNHHAGVCLPETEGRSFDVMSLKPDCWVLYQEFVEKHVRQEIDPIIQKLPLLQDVDPEQPADPLRRQDIRPWMGMRDKMHELNPYVDTSSRKSLPKGIDYKALVRVWMCMKVACAMRALQMNVKRKRSSRPGKRSRLYCAPLEEKRLSSLLRTTDYPDPNRDQDPCPTLFRMNMLDPEQQTVAFDKNLVENLWIAVFAHLYSGPIGLSHYCRYGRDEVEKQNRRFIRSERLLAITDHMKKTTQDFRDNRFSLYVWHQYSNRIPTWAQSRCDNAKLLLTDLLESLPDFVEEVKTIPAESTKRCTVVLLLANTLAKCTPETKEKDWIFVAHQVIATIEPYYTVETFGEIGLPNIHMGPGAKEGVKFLKQMKIIGEQENKTRTYKRKKRKTVEDKKYEQDQEETKYYDAMSLYLSKEQADQVLDHIRNDLSKEELEMLGAFKDCEKKVRMKATGRLISYIDLEHVLCKLSLILSRKCRGGRGNNGPVMKTVHCHPICYPHHDIELLTCRNFSTSKDSIPSTLRDIFDKTVQSFHKHFDGKKAIMPPEFLFSEEIKRDPEQLQRVEDQIGKAERRTYDKEQHDSRCNVELRDVYDHSNPEESDEDDEEGEESDEEEDDDLEDEEEDDDFENQDNGCDGGREDNKKVEEVDFGPDEDEEEPDELREQELELECAAII